MIEKKKSWVDWVRGVSAFPTFQGNQQAQVHRDFTMEMDFPCPFHLISQAVRGIIIQSFRVLVPFEPLAGPVQLFAAIFERDDNDKSCRIRAWVLLAAPICTVAVVSCRPHQLSGSPLPRSVVGRRQLWDVVRIEVT